MRSHREVCTTKRGVEALLAGTGMSYEFAPEVIRMVRVRSGGYCEYCNFEKATHFHHITPVCDAISQGMKPQDVSGIDNCRHVCSSCHESLDP